MAQVYTFTAPAQPGLTPPAGVVPTFSHPFSLQPYQVLTIAGCIITTTSLVIVRMYTKQRIMKATVWEDYTCCLGRALFLALMGIEYTLGKHGGGVHQWNTRLSDVRYSRQWSNYSGIVYTFSLTFTKLSILLLILRIFLSVQRGLLWWLTQGLIAINTLFYSIYFFIAVFLCSPRAKIWDPDLPGHCLKREATYIATATFNVVSDILMLSVPIYIIWHLQMSTRRKIGVSVIFGTGALACISSVIRLSYSVHLAKTKDFTYVNMQCVMWAFAEIAFGIICSCLPILPRFYQHMSSVTPYAKGQHNTTLVGPSTKASMSAAAQQAVKWGNNGGNNAGNSGGNWLHLDDRDVPGMPERTTVDVQQRTKDEDAVEEAVEAKDVRSRRDLEGGSS